MTYQAFGFEIKNGLIPDAQVQDSKQVNECTFITHKSPTSSNTPDPSTIHEIAQKFLNTFNVSSSICSTKKYEKISIISVSTFAFMVPTQDLEDEKSMSAIQFLFWMYSLDDVLDPLLEQNEPKIQINLIRDIFKIFINILNGDYDWKHADFITSDFEDLFKILTLVTIHINIHIPDFNKNNEFFVKRVQDYLNGFLWRYGRDQNGMNASENTYLHFRSHTSGFYAFNELIALVTGVKLSVGQRDNIEFIRYMNATAVAMSVTNDILSLKKEMNDGQTENLVINKVNKKIRVDMAIADCIELVNRETHEAAIYSSRLLNDKECELDMRKFIELVNYSLEGYLRFCASCKFYGVITITEFEHTLDV